MDVRRGVGVFLCDRVERIHGPEHSRGDIRVVFFEVDDVAPYGAAVACRPFLDVAHGAVAGEVRPGHEHRTPLLFDQVGVGEGRRVVVERVVPHDHRESPFQRWGHDVGAAGELAAPEVHRLVHGAALEQVVALVRAAARVEKREHARDEQRRLVVRDGVGPREDRGGLAVLAVRVGEEQRFGRREGLVQPAAFAHETAFDDRAVVDPGVFRGDEVVGLDVHADVRAVADRAVFHYRTAVYGDVVADADFADEPGADDAAAFADAPRLRGAGFGIVVDHLFQGRHGLRAVTVDGHQVGCLCRKAVVDLHRAPAAFVHRRHAHAVPERAPAAAFECRDPFDERPFADVVVAHP